MSDSNRKYAAFISYRHLSPDKKIAKNVHTAIEHYRIPEEYCDAYTEGRFGLVFRDEEELPIGTDLTESIRNALDVSCFLIVICTPEAKESSWVARELDYFLEHHDRNHVLAVLARGTPETSFPPALLKNPNMETDTETEPLAANLTDDKHAYTNRFFRREMTRVYAAMLGCPFDNLWQRERRYQQGRMVKALSVALAISFLFIGVVLSQNRQIQNRNHRIEEANEEIIQQNKELLLRESEILVNQGTLQYEKGDRMSAVRSSLDAIRTAREANGADADAEALLIQTLYAYTPYTRMRKHDVFTLSVDVENYCLTADGSKLIVLDEAGSIRCFDTSDQRLLWEYTDYLDNAYVYPILGLNYFGYNETFDYILLNYTNQFTKNNLKNETYTEAVSVVDGSRIWRYKGGTSGVNIRVSESGTRLLLDDRDYYNSSKTLTLLDAENGKLLRSVSLETGSETLFMEYGMISTDETFYFGTYGYRDAIGADKRQYFLWEFEEETVRKLASVDADESNYGFYTGICKLAFNTEEDAVYVIRYASGLKGFHVERVDLNGGAEIIGFISQQLRFNGRTLPGIQHDTDILVSDELIVCTINESVHFIDRKRGRVIGSDMLRNDVISALWADAEETMLALVYDSGGIGYYDTTNEPDSGFENMFTFDFHTRSFASFTPMDCMESSEGMLYVNENRQIEIADEAVVAVFSYDDPGEIGVLRSGRDGNEKVIPDELRHADRIGMSFTTDNRYAVVWLGTEGEDYHDREVTTYLIETDTKKIIKQGNYPYSAILYNNALDPSRVITDEEGNLIVIHADLADMYTLEGEQIAMDMPENSLQERISVTEHGRKICVISDRSSEKDVYEWTMSAVAAAAEETCLYADGDKAAIVTEAGQLYLYEVASGELLYEDDTFQTDTTMLLGVGVTEDIENGRVYICSSQSMTCIDTESYTRLFTLNGKALYNSYTNEIWFIYQDGNWNKNLAVFPAYSTEDLIAWGEVLVGRE